MGCSLSGEGYCALVQMVGCALAGVDSRSLAGCGLLPGVWEGPRCFGGLYFGGACGLPFVNGAGLEAFS